MRTSLGSALHLGYRLRKRQRAQLQIGSSALVLRAVDGGQAVERERRSLEAGGAQEAGVAAHASLAAHPELAVEVCLACSWSRLLLLPWIPQLTREERWQNYARARFEQLYGESAEAWDIRLARDWPGRDRIAVAWPAVLREALAAHANVRSVRVDLLEHLGVLLVHEPRFTGCLAEVESGRAGFLLLRAGRLARARWCHFAQADGLAAALRAEWASVVGEETGAPASETIAFALTPPAPQDGSELAKLVALLASGLGARHAYSLPQWT